MECERVYRKYPKASKKYQQGHKITPVKLFLFLQASDQWDKWLLDTMTMSRETRDVQGKAYTKYATSLPASQKLTQINGEINQIREQYLPIVWWTNNLAYLKLNM